eukprot:231925-Amphidinium_carterae.1
MQGLTELKKQADLTLRVKAVAFANRLSIGLGNKLCEIVAVASFLSTHASSIAGRIAWVPHVPLSALVDH